MDGGVRSKYRLTQQLLVILFATKLISAQSNIFSTFTYILTKRFVMCFSITIEIRPDIVN